MAHLCCQIVHLRKVLFSSFVQGQNFRLVGGDKRQPEIRLRSQASTRVAI